MDDRSSFTKENPQPERTTLLMLVQTLTRRGYSARQVEIRALELVESGRLVLIGNFHATPLRPSCRDDAAFDSNSGRNRIAPRSVDRICGRPQTPESIEEEIQHASSRPTPFDEHRRG